MANKDEVPLSNRQEKMLLYLPTQMHFLLEENVSRVVDQNLPTLWGNKSWNFGLARDQVVQPFISK